ncbi:MAG: ABC transporter ATP-binding protein/permease [Chloroflexales bacterium]|nr:ABC transporter ATP-binding protein/permease [Chloroflexales bacterium]
MSVIETSHPSPTTDPQQISDRAAQRALRRTAFWQMLGAVRRHKLPLIMTICFGFLNQGLSIASGAIGAYLTVLALTEPSAARLYPIFWLLVAVVLGRAVFAWLEMFVAHDIAYRLLADWRSEVYWALERLAPSYLLDQRSGDLSSTTMADVEKLEYFYAHTVCQVIIAFILLTIGIGVLAAMHWLLPLVLLPFVVFILGTPTVLLRWAERQGNALVSLMGNINAVAVDSVQGLREIVAFGQGDAQTRRLNQHSRSLMHAQLRYGSRSGVENAVIDALSACVILSIVALSAWLTATGRLERIWFPVSIILAASIIGPILELTGIARSYGVIVAAAERVFGLINRPHLVRDQVTQPPSEVIAPYVRFEHVGFRYQPQLAEALHDVSFAIAPGETVALVGHSGAGKSTCTHLLLRFWDVEQGRISIGGYDIRALPQTTLRDMIALVPQDIYLFNTSLLENIRLGRPAATTAEVEHAAQLALAHEFITALPDGYDTSAGERGVQLSGGQRQRIAIARAFLKDAPILMMDEAVSNLDTESEHALQLAMARIREGRTTLIIAHRLSTIRTADRLVVLDRGRIAEIGTHDELLLRNGVYARLIASQRGGIVPG